MTTTFARPRRLERPEARIMLQPLAAPSILGYFALGSALIIWGPWFAMAWGKESDYSAFFPFLLLFGGFGQLAAALWSYRARAAASAALHGSWAAFFLGLALIYLLATVHTITIPLRGDGWQSLGQWLIYMAVISMTTAFAALAHSVPGFVAQTTLATGATLGAIGLLAGSSGVQQVAGWVLCAAGALAYAVGAYQMVSAPGDAVEYEHGDPGVKVGQ
ncbi:MAG TPA: GPR1/FUN34/YaaH family transporter [Gaiellaceae bacterium]|nr:GPR1/FUN34/YaaH family transporter [Gaiellaceae bacterium]